MAYQIKAGSAAQVFHNNPQLVASQKSAFVLGHILAGTGAENSDLGLNILDVIIAGLKIDLRGTIRLARRSLSDGSADCQTRRALTCLIATTSPVTLSIPL